MAQTRRKRQTKHRGNAAGFVESRGRTGRKPTTAEKAGKRREDEQLPRRDRPPTWRGAFYRAMAAAVLLLLASLLLIHKANEAIALFPLVLILYVPVSYYTDLWMYRRRMRAKARQADGRTPVR